MRHAYVRVASAKCDVQIGVAALRPVCTWLLPVGTALYCIKYPYLTFLVCRRWATLHHVPLLVLLHAQHAQPGLHTRPARLICVFVLVVGFQISLVSVWLRQIFCVAACRAYICIAWQSCITEETFLVQSLCRLNAVLLLLWSSNGPSSSEDPYLCAVKYLCPRVLL